MSDNMDPVESRQPYGGEAEVSRRSALKLGAAAGAAAVLTTRRSLADDYPEPDPPPPTVCPTAPTQSPATRPFVVSLPMPPVATPVPYLYPAPTLSANIGGGEAPRADHQRWAQFPPRFYYDISIRPALHQFHPDIPASYVWGFNGVVPGPTFIAVYGTPILVRYRNNLPATWTGYGINETTVHLHNAHVGSESDGFAGDYFGPGLWKDHHYPNVLAGLDQYPPFGDPREAMHTLWYHDHRHSYTAPNTYRGLAGMYFLYDNIDSGNEYDTRPGALRLPSGYGIYDIPLVLADKKFCPDGTLYSNNPGGVPVGDKFVVNGVIQPYFRVFRRKYRFRVLNTGPSRIWTLSLSDGRPFTVIATDGNLLESPIQVTSLEVNVAERYDFIIDFSGNATGDHLYLVNSAAQFVNNDSEPDPVPGVPIGNVVMRFDVQGLPPVPDASQVPSTLCQYPPVNLNEIVRTREWNFDLVSGQFQINGQIFDPDRSDADIKTGVTERWILRNQTPLAAWTHPVHIHFEEFRVLSRNGSPPSPLESGRKDVIALHGGDEVELFLRFRDFRGKYMIHCHNMNHEDNFMLVRWTIGDSFPD